MTICDKTHIIKERILRWATKQYSKELEDGIFELRAKFSSNISRVLFFYDKDKIIVLTNGFIKKSQKTPKQEIELAKIYRSDYFARKEQVW